MPSREQRIQPFLGFGAGFDPVFQLDRVVDRPFVHPWPAQCAHQTLDLLLRARSALDALATPNMDQASGVRIVQRALEEPLRQIVSNAADEPSIVVHRVNESTQRGFGYNAATREYGDMLEMGVIDPLKVTRLALQNAASIASLLLTTDCMVAQAPRPAAGRQGALPGDNAPEMY